MKRLITGMLCILLIIPGGFTSASANSWGLTGDLYLAVSSVDTWNDYSTLYKQAGNIALMHSRYHNALMIWYESSQTLSVYTKAAYQPDDNRDEEAALALTNGGFTLSYGDAEQYTFYVVDGVYLLKEAVIGDFSVTLKDSGDPYGYIGRSLAGSEESAEMRLYIPLSSFNINLFPHSTAEIRQLNYMRAALTSGQYCLGYADYPDDRSDYTHKSNIGTGNEPVYSAPYGASAWRAANGKAAVGLSGELWTLGTFYMPDGEAWSCIRYDISQRTQRIGYIRASVLGVGDLQVGGWNSFDYLLAVDVQATEDTYLTDDPDVSQYPQFDVPEGALFTCLGLYGNDFAYVAAEVKDDHFTDGGAILWGFVPLKALAFPVDDPYRTDVQTDVMKSMVGEWVFYAGGSMAGDNLSFHEDGTFSDWYLNPDSESGAEYTEKTGTWYVTAYNPVWNLYWNDPPYELTLRYDNGFVNVKGLSFFDLGFSLTNNEGGGGYVHPEDAEY